ncbi:PilZ domain-containing protein [Azohydromonas australica]|uniref:PilZ domain-containing protein n=1 Tax=Azohydromonas australica TaxID=364039 RepID=UPI0004148568|nr:PilZ domain-containing protein [Azohydromonas australica]
MNATSSSDLDAAPATRVQLVFNDKAALYAAYIPLFTEGGLFIATSREHGLGDVFELELTLPGEAECRVVAGKVAWITPAHAAGGRAQGVGVALAGDAESRTLRARIEEILGSALASARPTQVF